MLNIPSSIDPSILNGRNVLEASYLVHIAQGVIRLPEQRGSLYGAIMDEDLDGSAWKLAYGSAPDELEDLVVHLYDWIDTNVYEILAGTKNRYELVKVKRNKMLVDLWLKDPLDSNLISEIGTDCQITLQNDIEQLMFSHPHLFLPQDVTCDEPEEEFPKYGLDPSSHMHVYAISDAWRLGNYLSDF